MAFLENRNKSAGKKGDRIEKEKVQHKKKRQSLSNKTDKKKKAKKSKTTEARAEEVYPCKSCGYTYGDIEDPLVDEEWLQCYTCEFYLHESCIYRGKTAAYCSDCRPRASSRNGH